MHGTRLTLSDDDFVKCCTAEDEAGDGTEDCDKATGSVAGRISKSSENKHLGYKLSKRKRSGKIKCSKFSGFLPILA